MADQKPQANEPRREQAPLSQRTKTIWTVLSVVSSLVLAIVTRGRIRRV